MRDLRYPLFCCILRKGYGWEDILQECSLQCQQYVYINVANGFDTVLHQPELDFSVFDDLDDPELEIDK